jgi:NDP-sugar pyrophosphorylase family protein
MTIYYSHEPEILNTGGGIKKMLRFFSADEPILVLNVDILSSVNYRTLFKYHTTANSSATLVINNNKTDRPLAFTDELEFLGRAEALEPSVKFKSYCFCGIQVIHPELFLNIDEDKFYSIDIYCEAVKKSVKIMGYDITGTYWRDIGTLNDLKAAENDIRNGIL